MSFKCLTLCSLLLLVSIGSTWAKTLQPRPETQLGQIKEVLTENEQLLNVDDLDGDDIIDDEEEVRLDELDKLDEANIEKLTKLIDHLEAMERGESRAARSRVQANRSGKRRNRSGPNRRRGNRRNGKAKRGNANRRNRNGRRRKNGAKRVN